MVALLGELCNHWLRVNAHHYRQELDMATTPSRTFIAAMQVTLDGYSRGPDGQADWVDSWADGLGLLPRVDAFVLGGGMFPDYEVFWAAIRDQPAVVAEWLGRDAYPREIEYARVAAETPHLVLSTTVQDASWPTARIVRHLDELRAFKAQPGQAVYVVGGDSLVRSLIDEGLLDELRLIVHPVAVGSGTALFDGIAERQDLELVESERTATGRIKLTYRVKASTFDHVQ
jgi:dihydrofolate reductase